jgi:excisionase family DNA binding protein
MAQKFVPLDDAADQLGISKERLNELRETGKVRAYRDGTSWKFRGEDLAALSKELAAPRDPSVSDLALEALEDPSDPSDSILVSDAEVGGSPNRPPSTVIGEKKGKAASESDLELTLDEESPSGGRGDLKSAAATSDVLASTSGSHILGPSETPPVPAGKFEDLDEIEIDLETESSKIQSDFDLPKVRTKRPAEVESDLKIVESDVHERKAPGRKADMEESGIRLAEDEEDDLVLSESGSDVTLSAGDSGINLISPSDSGLALDELDLDLGGSGVSSLDIRESAEKIEIEEEPPARARKARKDDDFLLTPLGEASEDESSSQVIELDSAADLQESAIIAEPAEETAVLEPVDDDQVVLEERRGLAPVAVVPAEAVHFTGANVAFLSICVVILAICGLMALDLLRNIWSWNQPYSVNAWLMESLNFFT